MSDSKNTSSGIGGWFFGLLFLLFLGLKLAEVGMVANWSWWLVTAPLWGPIALFVAGAAVFFAGVVIGIVVKEIFKAVRKRKIDKLREQARQAEVKARQAATAQAIKAEYDLRKGNIDR